MPVQGGTPGPIKEPQRTDGTVAVESTAPVSSGNGIAYHGGSVLKWQTTVYFIYYGEWGEASTNNAWSIFSDWANNIGSSSYYKINTSYYDGSGNHVMGNVRLGGTYYDRGYSHGKSMSEDDIEDIIDSVVGKQLPHDSNAVYFVLTAKDVTVGNFCKSYCGYHNTTHQWYHLWEDIQYSFVGDATSCPGACIPGQNQGQSPNNNIAADAMISVMTHELEESVSDPHIDAWNNSNEGENGDLCAWNFGATQVLGNGSQYNVSFGGRNFLIQQNWLNAAGGGCRLSYPHDTLAFDSTDSRLAAPLDNPNWQGSSHRAECAWRGAVTGLSVNPSTHIAHAAFCTDASDFSTYSHQSCHVVDFSAGDNRRSTRSGDWDRGFPKGECADNEYVAGVSQRNGGLIDSILCCAGAVTHSSCTPHYYWKGGSREDTSTGDWDYGQNKSDCGPGRYVAGVARNIRSGQNGGADAILCCQ
jgi:hypothetical protein